MRSEHEMLGLILAIAQNDERIRAVVLGGSRANPNAPRDILQDYDIILAVTGTAPFIADKSWLAPFGSRLMTQYPSQNDLVRGMNPEPAEHEWPILMLFADGSRVDLTLLRADLLPEAAAADSQVIVLMDKDRLLPALPPASDRMYYTAKPEAGHFAACANNFFWCMQNVAKGILRGELPYARGMLEKAVRPELDQVLSWYIGLMHDFCIASGKMGKYFPRLLPDEMWAQYRLTCAGAEDAAMWEAIFTACALFRKAGQYIAEVLGFHYPLGDDQNMLRYLNYLRALPSIEGDMPDVP